MTQVKQEKLESLIKAMTLKEKICQMYQLIPTFFDAESKAVVTGPLADLGLDKLDEEAIFSTGTALGGSGAAGVIDIQKKYLAKNPHHIPLMFMADVIHGFRTIFPVPLGMGCSWEPELVEKSAQIAAKEAAVSGIHVTFSPMVDLVRDPRWGRVMESTGEDPYLNSIYARAFVRGYQGEDLSQPESLAACVKHFAAYGAPEGGRDYNTVDISERMLREYYLPSYKAAVEEGCEMVMTAFNTVNSIPATANTWLFRDVLRKEWGFDGVVISDWGAVNEVIHHGVAADGYEAAEKAVKAGVDIEMMTTEYVNHLEKLVEDGVVDIALIDEAVLRILSLKDRLGLFENPYKGADPQKEAELLLCQEHRTVSREIAARSMVLLKNEDILPFDKDLKKIAVIGPYSKAAHILGPWSCEGRDEEAVTLLAGISAKIGMDKVVTAAGCGIEDGSEEEIAAAIETAKEADAVILALGEHPYMSGEAGSRAFITLPGRQEALAEAILALGRPTAVVLFNGRPLELTKLATHAPAILEAWFPGTEGGNAVADILFGDCDPSGRLTMSFPYTVGQIPVYYNGFHTGRPAPRGDDTRFYSCYLDIPNTPLYPFGYGLSYTTFSYADFALDKKKLVGGESILASVTVTNTGSRRGEEVVQLYTQDMSGSVVRPLKELKGFQKICLNPGESKKVTFEIQEEMLRFYDAELRWKSEAGKFTAFVGGNAENVLQEEFELVI